MNKKKLKLFFVILVFFMCFLVFKVEKTYGIYRDTLNTKVYLTILDSASNYTVTWHINDGSGNTTESHIAYNQQVGTLTVPTRTDYNFLGWYTANDRRIYSDEVITSNIDFYAHWQKIICKKVNDANDLHTETCVSGGCRLSGVNLPVNSTITYGTVNGTDSPMAGDAYNCDVNDDGIYDSQTEYGKFNERFYFLREIDNGNNPSTGSLIYYTSYDSNGPLETQHTNKDNLGSTDYNTALTWLPTAGSANNPWDNPGLIDFDPNNGKVSRFISFDDIAAVCGSSGLPNASTDYFATCSKWFLMENSRFQSNNLSRAGIWIQLNGDTYHRIHTASVNIAVPQDGANSENTARPVIEIPMSAFEGYVSVERYTISFNTHGGTPVIEDIKRNAGETLGTLPEPTLAHNDFDGWYKESTYNIQVTSSTVVTGDMTLHAKWTPRETNTVTFNAHGGTINGESTFDLVVDTGSTIDENDFPEAVYQDHSFDGWYTDSDITEPFDETTPITSDITLYAAWANANYVARVKGVGYETLAAAIAAVPTGKQEKTRVTILKNITLTESVSIPNNKWVELDGGNHTIDGEVSLFINNGNLDIIGGTMNTANSKTSVSIVLNKSTGILNVSGGNLTNNSTHTGDNSVIENTGGTVNITGGVLTGHARAATVNNKSGGTLNISGGRIIATSTVKGQAVYLADNGNVTISGNPYLESVSAADGNDARATVDNAGGTITITGGTIVSKTYSAVMVRDANSKIIIGEDDDMINILTPVMRGQRYGLEKTSGTVEVYDGIFESYSQSQAISTTNVTKPDGINFKTDGSTVVDEVNYHTAYLLAPNITVYFYEESGGTAIPVTVENSTAIGEDLPTPNPKQGYYFAGWFINNDSMQPVTSATVVMGTFNAYAKWVQSVSNATMDSTMSIEINDSDKIEFAENDIENVTYSSSNTNIATVDSDGTVHGVGIGTAIITLTGGMSGEHRDVEVTVTPVMRTVTFKNGDNIVKVVEIADNTVIGASNMPTTPTKTNYLFDGWIKQGESQAVTADTVVTSDIIAIAVWTPTIQLATIPSTFIVSLGSTSTIPVTNIPDGMESYTFSSSNSNIVSVNQTTGAVTGVAAGTTNITVTGTRSNVEIIVAVTVDETTYTVTFMNDNSETPVYTVSVPAGNTLGNNMPANLSETNYIFKGWVISGELTPFTSSTQVNDNMTVIANWRLELNSATITKNPDPLTFKKGQTGEITVTSTGSRLVEDCTFTSSNTNAAEVSYNNNVATINGVDVDNVTITITGSDSNQSIPIPVIIHNLNTITFDPDNGENTTVIQVADGSTIANSNVTLPADPTKTNYMFDGWYLYDLTNDTLTSTPLNVDEIITSDKTYKASWPGTDMHAAIGISYYPTLAEAISAAPISTETTIRIIQDIINITCNKTDAPTGCDPQTNSGVGRTYVPANKNIVIDGGTHTLSSGSATKSNVILNKGRLRILSGTFTSAQSTIAPLENSAGAHMFIDGGTISNTKDRGAIYNIGTLEINGGNMFTSSSVTKRPVVQNAAANASVVMNGGTITQYATSVNAVNGKDDGRGAIKNISGASATIKGGTVISMASNGAAVYSTGGTLVIGTDHDNNTYDVTNPVIQGEQYGIESTTTYSIFDGIIKGKLNNRAVNDFTKIDETNGIETGSQRATGTDGDYYTLYYESTQQVEEKYTINFNAGEGNVSPSSLEYNVNTAIDGTDFPTPTRTNYTFGGWYTDNNFQTPFATFTPNASDTVTYYAKWTYNSSLTPVNHIVTSEAMDTYFTNVSAWVTTDATDPSNDDADTEGASDSHNIGHDLFNTSISSVFTENSCSECNGPNNCGTPGAGTYCDQPKGYDTGFTGNIDVYSYDNSQKGSTPLTYVTVNNGVIYNMIPGKTYYWELQSDSSVYGVVSVTKNGTHYRRTLKTSIRNLRDLGGMSVDVNGDGNSDGTLKYGRLYRGAAIGTDVAGVNELKKLGITREIDLRYTGDNNSNHAKFETANYDIPTSDSSYTRFYNTSSYTTDGYKDVKITNYLINPYATPYISTPHENDFKDLKDAMKAVMRRIVAGDNVYFHCTIGTDRTGTIAYFLEGLLGVSEEDRLRDYEMTYFYGLTNRTRFHYWLDGSSINPRFYSMYRSYPSNTDIYNFYKSFPESDDDTLLSSFRSAMIE